MMTLEKYKVQLFGASVDTPELNKEFAQKNMLNFPLISDTDKSIAKAYGVLGPSGLAKRWTFLIDSEGIIRKIDTEVKPGTSGKDLSTALETLGVPKK